MDIDGFKYKSFFLNFRKLFKVELLDSLVFAMYNQRLENMSYSEDAENGPKVNGI